MEIMAEAIMAVVEFFSIENAIYAIVFAVKPQGSTSSVRGTEV